MLAKKFVVACFYNIKVKKVQSCHLYFNIEYCSDAKMAHVAILSSLEVGKNFKNINMMAVLSKQLQHEEYIEKASK